MNKQEVTQALVEIRDTQLETPGGVSVIAMEYEFTAQHPDAERELGASIFRDWLHNRCRTLVKTSTPAQLSLPGLDDLPDIVTTYDGEGGFVYKRLRFASETDMKNDTAISAANVAAVQAELAKKEDRDAILIPIMHDHGFATAGEAMTWLAQQP